MINSPHNFPEVKWINFLGSFSESAEKAALKKATTQKKTEKEKDLDVLIRESNRLKYRSGSGSRSRNLIFKGAVPV